MPTCLFTLQHASTLTTSRLVSHNMAWCARATLCSSWCANSAAPSWPLSACGFRAAHCIIAVSLDTMSGNRYITSASIIFLTAFFSLCHIREHACQYFPTRMFYQLKTTFHQLHACSMHVTHFVDLLCAVGRWGGLWHDLIHGEQTLGLGRFSCLIAQSPGSLGADTALS